jgi:hypothetical protein
MKIDKALNLIVPVYGDDEQTVRCYVHSTPVSRETFEKYFLIVSQTFSQIFNQGLGAAAGPAVAMLLLKKIAEVDKSWDGPEGVQAGLVEEMRRLTSVVAPGEDGAWRPIPLNIAVDRKLLTPDDQAEVENAIVFFIVVSAMLRRAARREMLETAVGYWGARTSSSTCAEFTASLGTSTGTASSGGPESAHAAGPQPAPPKAATVVVDGKPSSLPV